MRQREANVREIEEVEEEIKKVQTSNPVEIKKEEIKDLDGSGDIHS